MKIGRYKMESDDKNSQEKPEIPVENENLSQQAASLKIPPFWSTRPELWFVQVETQFRVKGITSSNTKYDYLVSSLNNETMELVADILLNPPSQNKYESLKTQLLNRSKDSEARRLDALLNKVELGDLKPSELYRQMKSLADNNGLVTCSLLKNLWIKKLPHSIQVCLLAIEDSHQEEDLFKIADRIFDSSSTSLPNKISAIQNTNSSEQNNQSNISEEIHKLSQRIKKLEIRQSRSRSASRKFNNTRRTPTPHKKNLCWFHKKFGKNAKKCIKPCSMAKSKTDSDKDIKNEN